MKFLLIPFLGAQIVQLLIFSGGQEFNSRVYKSLSIGLSYNLMTYSALAFLLIWLASVRVGRLILVILSGALLTFHYLDYEYFLQFGTHLPYSTIEYLNEPQHFIASLKYSVSQPLFFLLLLFPIFLLVALFWSPDPPFSFKKNARFSLFILLIGTSSGAYSNSYVAKNLENPLTVPGINYFAWTKDREKEIVLPKPQQAIHRLQRSTSSNFLSAQNPFIQKVSPIKNCSEIAKKRQQLCQPLSKPINILVIVLESFRAAEIGSLGSELKITPNFDKWSQKGILFSNFYANGFQTRHGEVAIYCSLFPNYGAAIMKRYSGNGFRCLPEVLKESGYATSWMHGSDSTFDNQFSFFRKNGFTTIYDSFDLPSDGERLGWGYSDELLFSEWLTFLSREQEPFFSSVLTITNHHPFEVPPEYELNLGDTDLHHYYNSMYYTDAQLGHFLEQAQQQPWYDHTLIFITADTSNYQAPQVPTANFREFVELRARIPLLILGGPITQPAVVEDFSSQIDLAPTITDALGLEWTSHWVGSSLLRDSSKMAYTNRPGAYWAVMSDEAQYYREADAKDHFWGDPTLLQPYKQLGQDWIDVTQWMLQEDLFWTAGQ